MEFWTGIAVCVAIATYIAVIYNTLVRHKNQVENAWAQIDVQLQRRYDLIPNLVETAKTYMRHERETLTRVIEARDSARRAAGSVSEEPTSARAVNALGNAENLLGQSLLNFNALTENYPELKANQVMLSLKEELTGTENRIGYARQAFNDATMQYNTSIQSFPNILVAPTFGFKTSNMWEVDQPQARSAIKVSFG